MSHRGSAAASVPADSESRDRRTLCCKTHKGLCTGPSELDSEWGPRAVEGKQAF